MDPQTDMVNAGAKSIEEAVAPLVAAGDKLSNKAQGFLGAEIWHFILLLGLILLMMYWLRSLHQHIGQKLCLFMQKKIGGEQRSSRFIRGMCYAFIITIAIVIAFGINSFTMSLTNEIFDINFAMLIMLGAQVGFWLTDWAFRHKGQRRSRFNRYIVAHLIKYIIVFFAALGILLVFDIHISEMMQWQGMSWLIPILSVLVFVPFFQNGGLSAVKFALTHPIRIGDVIAVNEYTGVFREATPYSITIRLFDGSNVTLPLNKISDGCVRNLQTRHSLEVSRTFLISLDACADCLAACIASIQELFKEEEKKCYLRTCSIEDVRGYYELKVVYNIRLPKEGHVDQKVSAFRETINLRILKRIQEVRAPFWRQPEWSL